ncbi:MAG: glycosyltransferase, partial [Lachnospiraceae bacterium]|nr:glycosyltransferase [Lachnospiraceae bacterium]
MEYPIDLPGGGQESTKTLCEGLAAGGRYKPVVACPTLLSTSPSDYSYRIVTYSSDENRELSKIRRISNFLARIGHFARIIRQVRPDLIHVMMSESIITFGALRVPGFFRGIPFIYTDRGLRFGYRKHSLVCIRETMKRAVCMITTTRFNADLWKDSI